MDLSHNKLTGQNVPYDTNTSNYIFRKPYKNITSANFTQDYIE